MLVVRETFTANPGQASKMAKLFRKVFADKKTFRVMTDLIGSYNTVIMEMQVKDLAEFERVMKEYATGKPGPGMDPNAFKEMSKYTEMYQTGRREVFQIVE